jgi:hypothetical protein
VIDRSPRRWPRIGACAAALLAGLALGLGACGGDEDDPDGGGGGTDTSPTTTFRGTLPQDTLDDGSGG